MRVARASVFRQEVRVERKVRTSFGVMDSRHAVTLVLEDGDGRRGIGESWVNFPAWAPWERVAAFERCLIPYLSGREVEDIPDFVQNRERREARDLPCQRAFEKARRGTAEKEPGNDDVRIQNNSLGHLRDALPLR